jgi:uncharacterized membrane protein
MFYLTALIIGLLAGLRAMTPLAAVSWGARLGHIPLGGSWLAFLGYTWTPWVLSALALAELVSDQLPSTPSRTVPVQFATRIIVGGACGAALGVPSGMTLVGAVLGAIGGVAGTLLGAAARARLADAFGRDLPAALIEDAVVIIGSILIVFA